MGKQKTSPFLILFTVLTGFFILKFGLSFENSDPRKACLPGEQTRQVAYEEVKCPMQD